MRVKVFSLIVFIVSFIIIIPTLLITGLNLFNSEDKVVIYNYKSEQNMRLSMEDYIIGVVAAEMPASFDLEALKAQAVAARTYALKKLISNKRLTTNSNTDQAWVSKKKLLRHWSSIKFGSNWFKIHSAVNQTKNLVMVYNNQLISAVYHSTSGGQTAAAMEVWGNKVSYLPSVSSSYEDNSPYYDKSQKFSWSQLKQKLNLADSKLKQIVIAERSQSGRVIKILINGHSFSGRQIRNKLALNSTKFKVLKTANQIRFIVDGFGHGVGMSQYGAEGLAQQGYNFRQILNHYYPGAKMVLEKYDLDV